MYIDRASFFIALGTLAAGSAGGYVAGQHNVLGSSSPAPSEPPTRAASTTSVAIATASEAPPTHPAVPACDDAVGAPGACPPPGYSADEVGCGALPTKRCEDFKQAMKPRVAEKAVACLNALNPGQRCDINRLNLCEHVALMSACTVAAGDGDAARDDLTTRCDAIVQGCGTPFGPGLADCRATLAGMTPLGRDRIAECMKTHCSDKGLLGCEASLSAPLQAVGATQ